MNNKEHLTTIHVLLVEDSPSVTLHISHHLSKSPRHEFFITEAGDLATALEKVADERIDVVLLDLGLPDSDGIDTLKAMHARASDVATVVFTGVDDEELAYEALRLGAQDYLIKGQVDGPLLVRAIRYAIERKQAEESLRESEEKHRTLLEAMPDVVYKIGADGRFKFVNEAIRALGYEPQELIGKHFSILIHPDDVPIVSRESVLPPLVGMAAGPDGSPKLLDERRTGFRMTRNLVLRMIPKAWNSADESVCVIGSLTSYGEISAVGQYATIGRTDVKKFAGTVGIIKDITGRKRAEEERASLEKQLMQSQKMEAIGRLAGGVAHDMNNVLGAIMGSAAVLELECDSFGPHAEDIANIKVACRKGQDLTRDLLGFARKGKYTRELLSLNDIALEAKALLSRTIPKTTAVMTDLDHNIALVEGDRNQIHHALMNVCINAADAIQGSGRLVISTAPVVIDDRERATWSETRPGKYVSLCIEDTGIGMDEETIEKVFEPFFTTKPKGKGTGLGLSMVYGVVKNHGGTIAIHSQPGIGTKVKLLLPATERQTKTPVEKRESKISVYPRKGWILLVDDEHIIRSAARRLLEKIGYTVILAENGRKALEIYQQRQEEVSIVLLDIIMPQMDGLETYDELVKIDPEVNVIFFSGYSRDDKVERLVSTGKVGYVHKPFDIADLSFAIKKALSLGDDESWKSPPLEE